MKTFHMESNLWKSFHCECLFVPFPCRVLRSPLSSARPRAERALQPPRTALLQVAIVDDTVHTCATAMSHVTDVLCADPPFPAGAAAGVDEVP